MHAHKLIEALEAKGKEGWSRSKLKANYSGHTSTKNLRCVCASPAWVPKHCQWCLVCSMCNVVVCDLQAFQANLSLWLANQGVSALQKTAFMFTSHFLFTFGNAFCCLHFLKAEAIHFHFSDEHVPCLSHWPSSCSVEILHLIQCSEWIRWIKCHRVPPNRLR